MQSSGLLALLFLCAFAAPCSASGDDVELSNEEMIDAVEAGDDVLPAVDSEAMADSVGLDSSMEDIHDDELDTTEEPEKTATSTQKPNEGTQGTDASSSSTSEPTKTSRTTASSGSTDSTASTGSTVSSTTSSESTSSSSKSSSSTTTTVAPQESNATTSTTQTTTAVVEGSVSFEVTSGNASDLVDAFANDTDGSVGHALATAIAAGADGVEAENVTILSVELDSDSSDVRRLGSAHLRSSRALQANVAIVVQYQIMVPAGQDSAEVAAALKSTSGAAVIEEILTIELQAVDPSLTIASIQVVAEVVDATTATTTVTERDSSFAHHAVNSLGNIVLACSIASLLLQ